MRRGHRSEVPFLLDNLPIALRLVFRGARLDLGPVQRHPPELHQAHLSAKLKDLVEQVVHEGQALPTESGEGREVGMLVGGEPSGRHVLVGRLLELARAPDPDTVAVEDDLEEHPRVERRASSLLVLVARHERSEVEVVVDHLGDDAGEVVRRKPLVEIGRKDERLLRIISAEDRLFLGGHAHP